MPPAPNCSAPSHGIGPRSRDPPSGLARPEGMGARPFRSPRFPPPAHRRFTVRGDRARGQPVENAPRPIRHCASCRPRARRCTAASIAPSSGLLDNIPNPAPTASSGEFRLMSVWDQTSAPDPLLTGRRWRMCQIEGSLPPEEETLPAPRRRHRGGRNGCGLACNGSANAACRRAKQGHLRRGGVEPTGLGQAASAVGGARGSRLSIASYSQSGCKLVLRKSG